MNDTLPPSVRRQEWGLIAGMAGTAFLISIGLLFYYTWHLGSDWGHFSEHWPALWDAIKDLILSHSLAGWMYDWQQVVEYGWEHDFIAHAGLPTLAAFLVAYAAGRLCYYPGGRDRLRHISGPRLYWHRIAIQQAKQRLSVDLQLKLTQVLHLILTRPSRQIMA